MPSAFEELFPDMFREEWGGARKGAGRPQLVKRQTFDDAARSLEISPDEDDRRRLRAGSPINSVIALHAWGCQFRKDLWNNRLEIAMPVDDDWRLLEDDDLAQLRTDLGEHIRFTPTKEGLHDAAISLGRKNSFDPWLNKIGAEEWDREDRLTGALGRDVFRQDAPLGQAQAALLIYGVVARALAPGTDFHYVPIIRSDKQGVGKGYALSIIAGGYYCEGVDFGGFDSRKKLMEILEGVAVAEMGEVDSLIGTKLADLKSFATTGALKARKAYGRVTSVMELRSVVCGTTNKSQFLSDDQHRRNPVLAIPPGQKINTDLLARKIGQLWAQAKVEIEAGKFPINEMRKMQVTLPDELWAQANEHSTLFEARSEVFEFLAGGHADKVIADESEFKVSDLHELLREKKVPFRAVDVATVLDRLGYSKARQGSGGPTVYRRPEAGTR